MQGRRARALLGSGDAREKRETGDGRCECGARGRHEGVGVHARRVLVERHVGRGRGRSE
jgi:hypothetical protein